MDNAIGILKLLSRRDPAHNKGGAVHQHGRQYTNTSNKYLAYVVGVDYKA